MSVDLVQVKKVGIRSFLAASTGVLFPVVFTVLCFSMWGKSLQMGLAAGAALAPTSLGFSAKLLTEVNQLSTPIGQMICAAAVIDDVLALCLLSEIKVMFMYIKDIYVEDFYRRFLCLCAAVLLLVGCRCLLS